MPEEATYPKIKILFVNIIAILYKATALNVSRLHLDMREVKQLVHMSKQEIWMRQMFIFLISGLLLIRFLLCFVGLVTNIVAIYPILTNSQPELLMPSIFVQLFDNVILNIYEIVLGYAAVRFLQPEGLAVFAIFLTKMFIKTSCCISVLNIYSDKHHQLTTPSLSSTESSHESLHRDSSQEFELVHMLYR